MKRVLQCVGVAVLAICCMGSGLIQQSSSVLNSVGLLGSGGSAVIDVSFVGQGGTGFLLGSADSAALTITTTAITLPQALSDASLSIPTNAYRVRIKVVSGTLVFNTQGTTDGSAGAFGNGFAQSSNQPRSTSPDQVGAGQVVTVDNGGTIAYVNPFAGSGGPTSNVNVTNPSVAITAGSGAYVAGSLADGSSVTAGSKADAKSSATDTTAITMMQVLKEISFMEQNPAQGVTPTVEIGNTPNTSPILANPAPATAGGITTAAAQNGAVSNTVLSAKASAGNFYGIDAYNPNSTPVTIEVWNAATGAIGSMGTPFWHVTLLAGASLSRGFQVPYSCGTAISYAVVTTYNGTTAPVTGVDVTLEVN